MCSHTECESTQMHRSGESHVITRDQLQLKCAGMEDFANAALQRILLLLLLLLLLIVFIIYIAVFSTLEKTHCVRM